MVIKWQLAAISTLSRQQTVWLAATPPSSGKLIKRINAQIEYMPYKTPAIVLYLKGWNNTRLQ